MDPPFATVEKKTVGNESKGKKINKKKTQTRRWRGGEGTREDRNRDLKEREAKRAEKEIVVKLLDQILNGE